MFFLYLKFILLSGNEDIMPLAKPFQRPLVYLFFLFSVLKHKQNRNKMASCTGDRSFRNTVKVDVSFACFLRAANFTVNLYLKVKLFF